jgi:type I restriction enzyme S subunit
MGEWKEYKLEELAEKIGMGPFGSNIKVSTFVAEGIPVISGGSLHGTRLKDVEYNFITEEHSKKLASSNVFRGDVIFTHAGNIGNVSCIPEDSKYERYVISQRQFFLRCNKKKLNPEFITYYFKSREGQHKLLANASSTGVPSIAQPVSYLKSISVVIPDMKEQESIASILSSLDDKIDLLHRQNKTLEALAETLFRQWFVPACRDVHGAGREEAKEVLEAKTLNELIVFDPREKVSSTVEYTFFDMKCLSNSSMAISDGIKRTVNSGSSFRNGDTLLAKITPCLENGKTGFVMNLAEDELARGSTEFVVMRAKEGISPYFVYCLARYSDFRNTAILSMTGTSGRQRVQTSVLRNYEIKYSKELMERFHQLCHPNFVKIRQNQIQIYTLTRLRDTLLPNLMSGEVVVKA